MLQTFRTIDAHVGGQPFRLIVGGMPSLEGATILERCEWLRVHADEVRRALVLEPRGHPDMIAAALCEPVHPDAHAGILFMDARGYPLLSGHGIVAATTVAIERGLLVLRDDNADEAPIVFETPAGLIETRARCNARPGGRRVDAVTFAGLPSFVHLAAQPVRLGSREFRVDVAYGGLFYAVVDTEATGIPLRVERLPELRRLGAEIEEAMNRGRRIQHPEQATAGIAGVVFTGPPDDPEAHLRSVTASSGVIDRSPGGTGTAALLAVLDAMGLLDDGQTFVHEGLSGGLFRARVLRRTTVGGLDALVPEIQGAAWVTGEHTFFVDDEDPFG
jgi:proline racemase